MITPSNNSLVERVSAFSFGRTPEKKRRLLFAFLFAMMKMHHKYAYSYAKFSYATGFRKISGSQQPEIFLLLQLCYKCRKHIVYTTLQEYNTDINRKRGNENDICNYQQHHKQEVYQLKKKTLNIMQKCLRQLRLKQR